MNFKSNKRKCTFLNLRKYFSLVLVLCLWGISPQLKAAGSAIPPENTKIVKGIVVDELNEPMIGVNVMEKGTANGTITDFNGKFQLKVSSTAKLVVTYIGYVSKELQIVSGDLKIQLLPDAREIDEVVVVGYANQNKKSVVGAITQTSGEALKTKGTMGNLSDALNGTIPGVTVMTKSSAPGGGGEHGEATAVLIRGMNTWNNAAPLILVDGMERNMNDISIDEIETFSVLKDASATAIFGVKGGNGVILITTKRGQIGKAKVTAEVNYSMKSLSRVEKSLSSYEGLMARNLAVIHELPLFDAANMAFYTSPRILSYFRDNVDPEKYTNVDWQDVSVRDYASSSKYNVNVAGGTDFVKYFTTLSYLSEGDLMNTVNNPRGYDSQFKYDRLNFRTNLDFALTQTTTFKVNLSGYFGNQQVPGGGIHNMWYGVYKYNPNTPLPVYADGTFGADDPATDRVGFNSYYYLLEGGTEVEKRTALTSDFELEQKLDNITKGLSFKGRFSFDNYFVTAGRNVTDPGGYTRKRYDLTTNSWVYDVPPGGKDGFDFVAPPLSYSNETISAGKTNRVMYYELALNYKRSFGKHNIGALGLFSRQENTMGSNWTSKREDWVGRITYDYDGKYLFETNGAYNGSEKFGPDYKFDFFPSFALGWRVSEESFIKNNIPQISNLKLRYSIGWVGSDNLGANAPQWGYITSWNQFEKSKAGSVVTKPNFGTPLGTQSLYVMNSFVEGTPGNPFLRWESARKQNYGIEIGLFKGLINGTVDYFNDLRYDMLIPSSGRLIPDFYGQNPSAANLGSVKSSGFEVDFKIQKKIGNVNLWGSYNWTQAINEIIAREDAELLPAYQKQAGFQINQNRNTLSDGMIASWDDMYTGVMTNNATTNSNTLPGDVRMVDYNGDGLIDGNDNVAYGYSEYPQNTYGFSLGADYKGFSAMIQFYGIYNTTINTSNFSELNFNAPIMYESLKGRTATPEYGVSDPDYRALMHKRNTPTANIYSMNGSLFRLKTAEVSYTIPKKLIKGLSLENVRFFVNGNNLFLWTKLPVDIEGTALSEKRYPTTKNINFGLNVTL